MFGASSSFAPSSAGSFFQQNQLGAQQPAPGSSQSGFQQPGYGQQQGGNVGGYGSQQSQPHQQQAGGYGAQGFGGQAGHAGAAGQGGLWGSASSSNLYGSTQQPSTGTGSLFPIGSTSGFGQPSGFGTSASGLPPTGNPTGADGPRRYIPGFLSSSSLGGNGPGTPQGYGAGTSQLSRDTSDEWVSTPSGGARATSPKAGFRSVAGQFGQRDSPTRSSPRGGVFGKSLSASLKPRQSLDPMEEDAPPTMSLLDEDAGFASSTAALGPPRKDALSVSPNSTTQQSPPNPAGDPRAEPQGHKVHVFGFPPSAQQFIIAHFSQIGDLLSPPQTSPDGGNWVTLTYLHEWAAQRAVRRNGEIVDGTLMVGCRWADEARDAVARDNIAMAPPSREVESSAVGTGAPTNLSVAPPAPTSSLNRVNSLRSVPPAGRTLKTFASTEAFAKPSTPLSSTSALATPGTPVGRFLRDAGRGPTAGSFEGAMEEERKREQRVQNGEGGLVTKAVDFIFGW